MKRFMEDHPAFTFFVIIPALFILSFMSGIGFMFLIKLIF